MSATQSKNTNLVGQLQHTIAADAQRLRHNIYVGQPHEMLIASLLDQVKKIDFRERAEFDPDDEDAKLKKEHYLVIIVEELLDLAKRNKWQLCQRDGSFYLFNGAFWKLIENDEVKNLLQKAAERMGADKFKARHYEFADQLFKQFIVSAHLSAPKVNRDQVRINLTNGTLLIEANKISLYPPNPDHFMTYQLPFAYDPETQAPIWLRYLMRVLPEAELQNVLAEGFGYIFIPSRKLKLEKMLLLSGDGSNGKSVAFEVLSALLGPENLSSYSLEKLTTEETHRAKIKDKLVNYCSEISVNLEASMFKALVSGESVPARELYGKPFQIENYAKLIANANKLPTVAEHTHAWFRRFLIIPFNVTIPDHEQDTQLANKIIAAELPGVLNWVLAGLRRLLSQGHFTDSEAVRAQTELYKRQSDTVRLFLDEYGYESDTRQITPLQDLYREYQGFCRDDGHRNPVNKLNFRKRIEGFNILTGNRNIGRVVFVVRKISDTLD